MDSIRTPTEVAMHSMEMRILELFKEMESMDGTRSDRHDDQSLGRLDDIDEGNPSEVHQDRSLSLGDIPMDIDGPASRSLSTLPEELINGPASSSLPALPEQLIDMLIDRSLAPRLAIIIDRVSEYFREYLDLLGQHVLRHVLRCRTVHDLPGRRLYSVSPFCTACASCFSILKWLCLKNVIFAIDLLSGEIERIYLRREKCACEWRLEAHDSESDTDSESELMDRS